MTHRKYSATMAQEGSSLCCAACGHSVGTAGQPWKTEALMTTASVAGLPGAGSGVHPDVLLRNFSCPRCAALLDSEVALPGDPFLNDVLHT